MIALLSAPSNLGLRPPEPGGVPGTGKAPEALREAGLFEFFARRGATDTGVVLPGRYVDDDATRAPGHVRNEKALIGHASRLADRVGQLFDRGDAPLVLGGDCSILLGVGIALARRGGRGLVHIDGHTDFRHPGNSVACASVAGEDLAAVTGRHWPAIADIDGLAPYFDPERVAHIGHRQGDDHAAEVQDSIALTVPAADADTADPAALAQTVREAVSDGYWLQLDVDVLDPAEMPAVDSPDPGGLSSTRLTALLQELAPGAIGASVTIFDPDLDPDGRYARLLTGILTSGFASLGATA